jgi:hypothetical protein
LQVYGPKLQSIGQVFKFSALAAEVHDSIVSGSLAFPLKDALTRRMLSMKERYEIMKRLLHPATWLKY